MANEIEYSNPSVTAAGLTNLYAVITQSGQCALTASGALAPINATNWPNAAVALADSSNSAYYFGNWPSGAAAGVYSVQIRQKAGGSAAMSDTVLASINGVVWTGTAIGPAMTSAGNLNTNPSQWGGGTLPTPLYTLPQSATLNPANPTAPAINGQVLAYAVNYPVSQTITLTNTDSSNWTQFDFTIKGKATDADAAALVLVKITNPSSGDGLILLNGAAPASPASSADGYITVSSVSGTTTLTIALSAYGYALAPGNYVWEVTRYSGGAFTKTQLATGQWQALSSVRAAAVAS